MTSSGVATLNHLNIVSGTATTGGGIRNDNQLTINYSTISDNSASSSGGGIFNSQNQSLTINNSTLFGNSAQHGGAILNENTGGAAPGAKLFLNNSTLTGNSASSSNSGAIYNGDSTTSSNATVTIKNSTLSGNSGGGIVTFFNDQIFLHNSIIANSISGSDCNADGGTVSVDNNSLIEDGSCNPALSGDPLLSTLGDYGGDTQTIALLPGSPALNAGDDATCLAADQRGQARLGVSDQ